MIGGSDGASETEYPTAQAAKARGAGGALTAYRLTFPPIRPMYCLSWAVAA